MKKTSRPKRSRRFMLFSGRSKGYTLIELVVVMVVAGILLTTVTVSTGNIDQNSRTANAAFQALSDIRYAQETAMETGRAVDFNVLSNKWEARFQGTGELLPSPKGAAGGLSVTLNIGEFRGVTITYSQIATVRFSGTGRPLTSGGSNLTAVNTVLRLNTTMNLFVYPSGYTILNQNQGGCGCGC